MTVTWPWNGGFTSHSFWRVEVLGSHSRIGHLNHMVQCIHNHARIWKTIGTIKKTTIQIRWNQHCYWKPFGNQIKQVRQVFEFLAASNRQRCWALHPMERAEENRNVTFSTSLFRLVVTGTCFIFPYIWNNHPNWLIFFRGFETTNQFWIQFLDVFVEPSASFWLDIGCNLSSHIPNIPMTWNEFIPNSQHPQPILSGTQTELQPDWRRSYPNTPMKIALMNIIVPSCT